MCHVVYGIGPYLQVRIERPAFETYENPSSVWMVEHSGGSSFGVSMSEKSVCIVTHSLVGQSIVGLSSTSLVSSQWNTSEFISVCSVDRSMFGKKNDLFVVVVVPPVETKIWVYEFFPIQ